MKKHILFFAVIVLALIGGVLYFDEWSASAQDHPAQPQSSATAGVGQKLPEFTLPSLTGKEVTVKSAGKPIVLNFFATWCPPCRQEMPEINMFINKYKTTVDFYAVNLQESPGTVADFMDENGYSFKDALLFDANGRIARIFRVSAIPTTLIADKTGVIRHVKLGAVSLKQLEDFLENLPKD